MKALNTIFGYFDNNKISEYSKYWNSVTPSSNSEIFKRWLFAYTSIHTTWEANVRAYKHIKNFEQWINDKSKLDEQLLLARAGCHNQKANSIWDFSSKFWNNPDEFRKSSNESWVSLRNRLSNNLIGIGLAKTSFALELCYPNEAEIVCLDVHMLRLLDMNTNGYRKDSKKDVLEYNNGENIWIEHSSNLKASPYITRCLYWDINQGQKDSRYWSECLESQLSFDFSS